MKKLLSLLLVLLLVLSVGALAMADTTLYSAYVYYEDGMPKYWLDFVGSMADNLVLHCCFFTDSWYEACYILDLKSAIPNSHQNTYRIENVWDARGNDISNWFKTVSLSIEEGSVSLYIERNPATLAGGLTSTLLDGLYVMTPAEAGVVYEYFKDSRLENWLVLNADNAELHFSDGRIWLLEVEKDGEHTANVTRIVSASGEEIPFQSFSISYVQGAMLLNAKAGDDFSGTYLMNPRVFLQRSGCSAGEIARMAQMYYYRHYGYYPPAADVEANGDGTFSVHLYELVDNGDGSWHMATSAWYTIDASGIGSDDLFGSYINLQM